VTPDDIYDEMVGVFRAHNARARRRFLPGLLVSFIKLIQSVRPANTTFADLADFYCTFPRQTNVTNGGLANTLIIARGVGQTLSIRPFYEEFQSWVRSGNKRLDYPKSPAHATQAWQDYVPWLNVLVTMEDPALAELEQRVRAFVLNELPIHVRDTSTIKKEPPRFYLFLDQYDFRTAAGPTGAAYQGTVFAYLRADAAHLQVQVAKVRVGGKREGRVGDVDARDGEALVLAAEVKQYVVQTSDVSDFEELSQDVAREGALGLIVALDFGVGARAAIEAMGLQPVSKQDLVDRVRLWDALKQRIAVQALLFYVSQVEQNTQLSTQISSFFLQIEKQFQSAQDPDTTIVP